MSPQNAWGAYDWKPEGNGKKRKQGNFGPGSAVGGTGIAPPPSMVPPMPVAPPVEAPPATPPAPPTSALDAFKGYFATLGVNFDAELEAIIMQAITDGYTVDQFDLLVPKIEQTGAFRTRFAGYEAGKKLDGSLTVGRYLQLEGAYKSIMSSAGMPAGFYDDPSDFGQWIAKGIAPDEVQARVNLALDAAQQVDPTMRNIMARFYGLSTGDVASYFLDPNRARPVIEHQYRTAGVASWAARHGFAVNDISHYENLATSGVTAESAMQGYGTVRALNDTVGKVASVYGETFTQADAENDVFFNQNEKRQRIVRQERGTFSGQSRGATGSAERSSY